MSIAIWWVKEFGGDLVLAEVELRDAERLRLLNENPEDPTRPDPKGVEGRYPGLDLQDTVLDEYRPGTGGRRYTRLERRYLRDAKWDSRTDAFFYVCGAWIAAGVVTDDPALTDNGWAVGSEVVGMLLFVGFFLWRGPVWAARQKAIDAAKPPRSRRLATLQSALTILLPNLARSERTRSYAAAPIDPSDDGILPLNWLYAYAADRTTGAREFRAQLSTGRARDATAHLNRVDLVDHLVVCGEFGSSRTLLGAALVCDAALAPLELGVLFHRATRRREARYAKLSQIAMHNSLDIAYAPNIAFDPEKSDFLVIDDVNCPRRFYAALEPATANELAASLNPALETQGGDVRRLSRDRDEQHEVDVAKRDVKEAIRAARPKTATAQRQKFVWILTLGQPTAAAAQGGAAVRSKAETEAALQATATLWVEKVLVPALMQDARDKSNGASTKTKFEFYPSIAVALISRVTDNEWIKKRLEQAEAADLGRTRARTRARLLELERRAARDEVTRQAAE